MSKIADVMRRAEQDRRALAVAGTPGAAGVMNAQGGETERPAGEAALGHGAAVRAPAYAWDDATLSDLPYLHGPQWPVPARAHAAARNPNGHLNGSGHDTSDTGPVDLAVDAPEAWDRAMQQVAQQLVAAERRAAGCAHDRQRLAARLEAAEQLLIQVELERSGLCGQLEQAAHVAAAVEAARAVWVQRLEALRACQALAYEVRMAEQELLGNAAVLAHITQSQQRVSEELAHYGSRGRALEAHLRDLRARLRQTLAATGTVHPTRGTEPEESR